MKEGGLGGLGLGAGGWGLYYTSVLSRIGTYEPGICTCGACFFTNLHAFMATLGSIGFVDRLCGMGIMVLRKAYETPREKRDPDGGDDRY